MKYAAKKIGLMLLTMVIVSFLAFLAFQVQQHLDELYAQIDAGNVGDGYTKEMAYDDLFHGIIESIVYPRDKVYSDKSLYNEALEEAERRKSENMKKLYSYQILKS